MVPRFAEHVEPEDPLLKPITNVLREDALKILHLIIPFMQIRARGSKKDAALPRVIEDQRARVILAMSKMFLWLFIKASQGSLGVQVFTSLLRNVSESILT